MSTTTPIWRQQGFNSPEECFIVHLQKLLDSNENAQIEHKKQGERLDGHAAEVYNHTKVLDSHGKVLAKHGDEVYAHGKEMQATGKQIRAYGEQTVQLQQETKCLGMLAIKSVAGQVPAAAELLKQYEEVPEVAELLQRIEEEVVLAAAAADSESTKGPQQEPQQP